MSDPAQRYKRRGNEFAPFREVFPPAVFNLFHDACGLEPGSPVADVSSADGNFSRLLLERGYRVFAVERLAWLREMAQQELGDNPSFECLRGRTDATTLADSSMEAAVVCGPLPWQEIFNAREEFRRILQPGGWLFLVRNVHGSADAELLQSFDNLLVEFGTDYRAAGNGPVTAKDFENFFGHRQFEHCLFPNAQTMNWESFKGRLLASCYAPGPGHPDCPPMLRRLRQIYEAHQSYSEVHLPYDTAVTFGRMI
ncbi:MAG: class I SAM-dependent methyltransferase [Opitutales bacterium]